MKLRILIAFLFLICSQISAQVYPEVTIKDIQYVDPDSLLYYGALGTEPKPQLFNDTVTVVGVMMCPPYEHANPDSQLTLHSGSVPAIFLQDTAMTEWSGVITRLVGGAGTIFDNLDSGTVIKVTGVVHEYNTTTQFDLISFEPQNILGQMNRPQPVLITLDSLIVDPGTSNPNYLAEKWEGVYVEIRNVTTTEPNIIGYNTFKIFDSNGSSIVVGTMSDYWRRQQPPLPGTNIDVIRGFIETRTNITDGWFMIDPVFDSDIQWGAIIPPNISNIGRDLGEVGYGDAVMISADIFDQDGTIDSAQLYYAVNEGTFTKVDMALTAGNTYSATIPAQNDSTIISYYVRAVDNLGAATVNPIDIEHDRYFYFVLDRSLTIRDIQLSPFGSGYSAYDGFDVTVRGIVTADTSDFDSNPDVYIQDGAGPWHGIRLNGTEIINYERGDDISVTGTVDEDYSVTWIEGINSASQIVYHGTGTIPDPILLTTDIIGTNEDGTLPAESYEGLLIRYNNIEVTAENADGNPGPNIVGTNNNYGEMFIADASNVDTRVELQDGKHDYHNFWSQSLQNQPIRVYTGDTFDAIIGVQYYSFGDYKLIPRKNNDFIGHVTDVKETSVLPEIYSLQQNYPNPFNPRTIIEYSIPEAGFVSIKVYNILGQLVATLVNEFENAGNYRINFNASNLSSGLYLYRIETNNFTAVKKMMLLK